MCIYIYIYIYIYIWLIVPMVYFKSSEEKGRRAQDESFALNMCAHIDACLRKLAVG